MGVYLGLGGCKFHHVIACCIALKLSQHCQPRTDLMVNVKIIWETTGIAFWSVPPPSIFAVMEDWNRLSHWSVPLESDPPPLHTAAGTFLQRMWPLYPLRPKPLRDLSCPEERSSLLLCHSHLCSSLAESQVHTLHSGDSVSSLVHGPCLPARVLWPSLPPSHSHSFVRVAPAPCAPTSRAVP